MLNAIQTLIPAFFGWCSQIVNKIGESYVLLFPFVLYFVNRIITLIKKLMGKI